MIIISKKSQWLGDIAARESGSFEALFKFAVENDLSITDDLQTGTALNSVSVVDKMTSDYFASNDTYFASNDTYFATSGQEADTPRGIGYMVIGKDFIVS